MIRSTSLITWYQRNKRDLPWRETHNPYCIWISEIILQQTRVQQGLDYYLRFLEHFPTLQSLAEAPEQDVLRLWQGLGYYSRARNLHAAAKQIMADFGGTFPIAYKDVRSLRGIGDYTAAAICSFAYNMPVACVDGNAYRVLSRLNADPTPIDTVSGKRHFQQLADGFLNQKQPALHNQAVMDLGATICLPKSPRCEECPLKEACEAHKRQTEESFPIKQGKTHIRDRFFTYYLIRRPDGRFAIHQRTQHDIWQHLWELPLLETDGGFPESSIINHQSSIINHILSHQRIHARLIRLSIADVSPCHPDAGGISLDTSYQWVNEKELDEYPLSRLTELLLASG